MKIVSIVGARPEFVQATPISRALRPHHQEILVHTGQHYDYAMSQTFFEELNIPAPDHYLGVGSGSHAKQTAEMMVRMEEVLLAERPDVVVVRGDTNSTIAGALVAAKLGMPLAHVEAGERSFDRSMPEEINRLVTDRLADLHFCVSHTAVEHLAEEGILGSAHWVGDVMYDVMLSQIEIARQKSTILQTLGVEPGHYALVTVHRAANTDNTARLAQIVDALNQVDEPVIFPAHPRTRKVLTQMNAVFAPHVRLIDPLGYFDIITLEDSARVIATDSGGVQREAYFLGVPCITLREETEWHETVSAGWNRLVGVDTATILDAWRGFRPSGERPAIFGNGDAGQKIATILTSGQSPDLSTVAVPALEEGVLA